MLIANTAFRGFQNERNMTRILDTVVGGAVAMECDVLEALRMPDQIQWFANMNPFPEVTYRDQILYVDGGHYLFIRILTAIQRMGTYHCVVVSPFITVRAPTTYQLTGDLPRGNLTEYIPLKTISAVIGEPVTYIYAAAFVTSTTAIVRRLLLSCDSAVLPPLVIVSVSSDVVLSITGLSGDEETRIVTIVCDIAGTTLDPQPTLVLSFSLSSEFALSSLLLGDLVSWSPPGGE